MARPKPIRHGQLRKPLTITVSVEDYNWVARQPGLEFTAIMAAAIRSMRDKKEDEPADYAAIAEEVKTALGGIEKMGPQNEVEANRFFAWCQSQPTQFQRMDFEARWKAYQSSLAPPA